MLAGISTVGIKFGYGTGSAKPTKFTLLNRINQIGSIALNQENIDASALEDAIARYVTGRADIGGGSVNVTINMTDETVTEWETLISAYQALTGENRMYFEVYSPKLTKAFFFVAQPPTKLPMPEMGQNGLLTAEIALTIEEYIGLDAAVEPTANGQ